MSSLLHSLHWLIVETMHRIQSFGVLSEKSSVNDFDLFQGVSAAIIFLAAWLIKKYGDITKITTDEYTLVPCGILVGVGVLIFITALFGCCGTCRDNKCCLSTVSLCLTRD